MAYYFLINKETNIVENNISLNDINDYQVPETHILIPVETTPALDWVWNEDISEWVYIESIGNGGIGDVWDGTKVSQIKPEKLILPEQPATSGIEEI